MARRPNSPSPQEIFRRVDRFEESHSTVHKRMDSDYDLFTLKDNIDKADDGRDEGYREVTSNDSRTYAKKAIALLSDSAMPMKVPVDKHNRETRSSHNDKERVAIGLLNQAEDRLGRMGYSEGLKGAFAWYSCIRGYVCNRHLLVKPEDGSPAYVDITPWDARRVSWAMGASDLAWVCHKTVKSRAQIKEEYGVSNIEGANPSMNDHEDTIEIYDYYDSKINKVVTKDQVLKKATPHGSSRVPANIVPVGATPIIIPANEMTSLEDVGESIFADNRSIYPKENLLYSILYELSARSLKPVLLITSPDGSVTLDEDPFKDGTQLSFPEGVNVEVLPLHQAAADTLGLLGLLDAQKQRGSLPNSAFGELQFTLSGFAINSLSQGIATIIKPMLAAMRTAYTQIINDLIDQYTSKAFKAIELSGTDNNREWFSEEISPDSIKGLPRVEIKLSAQLPKDDVSKAAMVAQLKQMNIVDDRTLLEDYLEVEDSDQILDRVKEQAAQLASPVAAAFQFMRAAAEEGETEMAAIYMRMAEVEVMKQEIEIRRLWAISTGMIQGPGQQPQQPGHELVGPDGQPVRMNPMAAPNASIGVPPPVPNEQIGPVVPPGMPRPGARNGTT